MNNPCRECELLTEDKSCDRCKNCRDRIEYVRSMGAARTALPDELTHMAGRNNKMNIEMKICSDPDCRKKGMNQPLSKFRKNRYGYMHICSDCLSRRQSLGQKKRIGSPGPEDGGRKENFKDPANTPKDGSEMPARARKEEKTPNPFHDDTLPEPNKMAVKVILLNFMPYPELYKTLEAEAKANFREIQNQALFILSKWMEVQDG